MLVLTATATNRLKQHLLFPDAPLRVPSGEIENLPDQIDAKIFT